MPAGGLIFEQSKHQNTNGCYVPPAGIVLEAVLPVNSAPYCVAAAPGWFINQNP
jgi:hypothetical protein